MLDNKKRGLTLTKMCMTEGSSCYSARKSMVCNNAGRVARDNRSVVFDDMDKAGWARKSVVGMSMKKSGI